MTTQDRVTINTYPTLAAAQAAQSYFTRHGLTVRPGPPVLLREGWAVAMAL